MTAKTARNSAEAMRIRCCSWAASRRFSCDSRSSSRTSVRSACHSSLPASKCCGARTRRPAESAAGAASMGSWTAKRLRLDGRGSGGSPGWHCSPSPAPRREIRSERTGRQEGRRRADPAPLLLSSRSHASAAHCWRNPCPFCLRITKLTHFGVNPGQAGRGSYRQLDNGSTLALRRP